MAPELAVTNTQRDRPPRYSFRCSGYHALGSRFASLLKSGVRRLRGAACFHNQQPQHPASFRPDSRLDNLGHMQRVRRFYMTCAGGEHQAFSFIIEKRFCGEATILMAVVGAKPFGATQCDHRKSIYVSTALDFPRMS